jgi:hypothetical protein
LVSTLGTDQSRLVIYLASRWREVDPKTLERWGEVSHTVRKAGQEPKTKRIATNCMLDDLTFTHQRPIHAAQEIVPVLESVY